jgi:hypothetical protein
MLKSEVKLDSQKVPVSFFEDDTIQVVRKKIGGVIDTHPDRLFILIGMKCSRNYYKNDPRHWEALFERLSLNGQPIEREIFDSFQKEYRIPALDIKYETIDKDEWMSYPDELSSLFEPVGDFIEYRILGVEERKSFCLPLKHSKLAIKIPSVSFPIPEKSKLFSSFYSDITDFIVKVFEKDQEGAYFPLIQSITPSRLTNLELENLDKETQHLKDLLALDPPTPTSVNILKATWYVQFVDTDFGIQIRNKFEQIFYGQTVSEEVPCITFFTSLDTISRHKFFTKSAKTKAPLLDLAMWSAWWTKSRPPRSRPTLVLYRGTSRENYDRISITSIDMTFACYRDITNTQEVSKMKLDLEEWFSKFDAIVPFINNSDLMSCRWTLQDIQYNARYEKPLEELDTRRLNCVTSIFDEMRTQKTIFRFLRTDYASDGLTSLDIRILDLLKDSPYLTPNDIHNELNIPLPESTRLLSYVKSKIDEDPSLLTKVFRGFPLYKFMASSVIATDVYNVERSLKYLNILHYILSNPTSKELDRICPKRIESVEPIISTINTNYDTSDFDNLFDYIEGEEKPVEPVKQSTRVVKKNTKYGYLLDRLETFDPDTFSSYQELKYPKVCEHIHQPIVLSKTEIEEMLDEYNPKRTLPENKILDVSNPDGSYICPEYWCMHDKIPLKEDQLVKVDGVSACPVCKGKVRNMKDANSDTREFSVIKRDKKFGYPRYTKLISAKNQKSLPCCLQTPEKAKKLVSDEDVGKYYIMKDNTTNLEAFRLAFLSSNIIESLNIKEDYDLINKSNGRIQTGVSAFFRVGIGRPSESLPTLMNIDKKILSPSEGVKWILKTTFFTTWPNTDEPLEKIDKQLRLIPPFDKNDSARENVNRIISSIDNHYKEGKLTHFQELEYCSLILGIDIFKIDLQDESMTCTFYTRHVVEKQSALAILYNNDQVDCLCHVVRTQRKFEYRANIFESPFRDETMKELINLREKSCHTNVPSFSEALQILLQNTEIEVESINIILDPFGRAQAIYIPDEIVLPFKNTAIPELTTANYIYGYHDIKDNLPDYTKMRMLLDKASKLVPGFKVETDLYSGDSVNELLLVSGLRVPIKPFKMEGSNDEVFNTIFKEGETDLVFGDKNEGDRETYKSISYAAELFEFLIFQLSKDIDDQPEIKVALSRLKPVKRELEKPLHDWFEAATVFHQVDEPLQFLSKIRIPCGQLKSKKVCDDSHMCGWDGKCKIEVRHTFSKTKLFNKLLGTLLENPKTRYSILDSLTTPFFSTILYLQLPNEVILTDYQIKTEKAQ